MSITSLPHTLTPTLTLTLHLKVTLPWKLSPYPEPQSQILTLRPTLTLNLYPTLTLTQTQALIHRPRDPRSYLGLNSFLNLLNRWALGLYGLKFPLIMTAAHMIFGSCALSPLMFLNADYNSRHATVLKNDWKGLAVIAMMNGFQIACNNASLTVMELSMNQVIRASVPVLVAIIGVCIENKVPTKGEVVCLFVVSIGVM